PDRRCTAASPGFDIRSNHLIGPLLTEYPLELSLIKGHLQVSYGIVTAFLGIPYAEPPVGALRFQKPIPHQPWSHVLEASSFGNACHQPPLTGYPESDTWTPKMPQSEDCLSLNIWVPHPQPNGTAPILVWIHGGGFFSGAASLDIYDGRFLAATGKVIVASMNYRLGALGFLSLPPAAPGNVGLWDQRLALRWLWDNAAAFGGDPAHFILAGQGAGAASVGFHLLSPGSRPLFTSAVLMSGAPNAPWAWISLEEAKERGQKLGQQLGCSNDNSTALVGCLQGQEPGEFPKHEFSILNRKKQLGLPFVPTPDGDFLPDTPPRLLQAEHGQPMPIVAGFTANEGSYILLFAAPRFNLENASSIGWEEVLQMVRLIAPGAPEEAVQAVALRYSQDGEEQGEARYRWVMEQILGDYFIVCPVAEMARREAKAGSPVYTYHFAHRTSGLSTPEWMGVPQGSEVPYLFGTLASVGGGNHTEAEEALSRKVMHYANFSPRRNYIAVQQALQLRLSPTRGRCGARTASSMNAASGSGATAASGGQKSEPQPFCSRMYFLWGQNFFEWPGLQNSTRSKSSSLGQSGAHGAAGGTQTGVQNG
uniref:Carboxylesterase type B domain-containing protein n=1 Tax=Chelydra serpentina TaxID=8475 RepID=A0A8C3XUS2_CHESE